MIKRKGLMSIGEVSKIKNVSIKALRYYDKIGILVPSYVDSNSGYRYYSVEQLRIVDLIVICLGLKLPLKEFKQYVTNEGVIDIEKMIKAGELYCAVEERKLNKAKRFLALMGEHINRTKKVQVVRNYQEQQGDRYLLVRELFLKDKSYNYIRTLTELYEQCDQLDIVDTFNQGVLLQKQQGIVQAQVFLEIPVTEMCLKNLVVVSEAEFRCHVIEGQMSVEEILQEEIEGLCEGAIVMIQELFGPMIDADSNVIEIQKKI